ncbi:MAG TPA: hydrolase [Pirellula sp.]|nr:hydrolase [Pirellula sp.]
MKPAQAWLQSHQDQMTDELEQLCNVNSGSVNVPGLHCMAEWLTEYFSPLGVSCQKIELPTYQTIDDMGALSTQTTGHALRWDLSGTSPHARKRLLLNIHYDTVYGPSSPFQFCERYYVTDSKGQPDSRMRGPGVLDAKGGIVVMRWAALAAKTFLDLSNLDLSIVLTPDEEIGSPASIELWRTIAPQFDFAMLYEPTLADGSLVSQRKGTGTFIVLVRGKSAHSGRNYHDGRNAIIHACKVALAMDALNGLRSDVTVNVGRARGGDAVNVVPDLAVLRINVRVSSGEDKKWIEDQVQHIVQLYCQQNEGYHVEVHGGILSSPKVMDQRTSQWMELIAKAGANIGESIQWKPSGGASDGNKLAALGLSNIDTLGPEGDLLHSNQEWVRLSSLPRKAALTVAVIEAINYTSHSSNPRRQT